MKVEYLIILKQEDKFCNNTESFKKFILVDDDISIEGVKITFNVKLKKKIEGEIRIKTGMIDEKNERFFKVELSGEKGVNVELFTSLCRRIKKIVRRINPENIRINTLWDDVGREYAIMVYPLINEVENLMRKLISQFLLINVGMDWLETAIHDEIQEKIKGKTKNNVDLTDELYNTDFIHLSDVLFKKYRNIDLSTLDNIIIKAKDDGKLDISKVSQILPVSNWERYFSTLIDYDEDQLKQKWKLLYEYRNEVAHNRFLDKASYEKIVKLHKELISILNKTILNLDKIELEPEQKDEILETYTDKRLVKIAKELNVGLSTIVDFLQGKGFKIDARPTAIVSHEMYEDLLQRFGDNTAPRPVLRGLKRMNKIDVSKLGRGERKK